jgi:glycosyltransferase involved in cell wall biosynthesis
MALGLPVLLADTEVLREVGADAADYYSAGEPADLARAVLTLRSNPARLAALAALGRVRSRLFSWDRVAQDTLLSFERALSAR